MLWLFNFCHLLVEVALLFSSPLVHGETRTSDVLALQALWEGTNGPNWIYSSIQDGQSKWDFSGEIETVDPCGDNWKGVVCFYQGDMNCTIQLCNVSSIYLSNNNMSGTIPSEFCNLDQLYYLSITSNSLSGQLPDTFGLMSHITSISFSINSLIGTIPESIISGPMLLDINMYQNCLTGSIPDVFGINPLLLVNFARNHLNGTLPRSLGSLSSTLTKLYLDQCSFSGSLPSELLNFPLLEFFFMGSNCLTGSLPSVIDKLSSIITFDVSSNRFNGSLPIDYGNSTGMEYFSLYFNSFSGTIPTALFDLTNMAQLIMSNTRLCGSIPSEVGRFSRMHTLSINDNYFDGSIPEEIGCLSELRTFQANNNYLTGTLPMSFAKLEKLYDLVLQNNKLSGNISIISDMPGLTYVDVGRNQFTGPLPTLINMKNMQLFAAQGNFLTGPISPLLQSRDSTFFSVIQVGDNLLTGSIPTIIGSLDSFRQLSLFNNLFTSSLPRELATLSKLEFFDASRNLLTGMIPCAIDHWANIQIMYLQDNKFDSICNNETKRALSHLEIIDISKNVLQGAIPVDLFSGAENLRSLSAGQNCFTSSLDETICLAPFLEILSLDGMSSSSSCSFYENFQGLGPSHGYMAEFVGGTIPACLFNMPSLTVLHLAGNGFEGPLHDILNSSSPLQNISVCNNRLTGSIPLSILRHSRLLDLDLSNNEFRGTFEDAEFPVDLSLKASVNRLSGAIPAHFTKLRDIDVLSGNMFTCTDVLDDLTEDAMHSSYVCGSRDLESSFMTFSIVLVVIVAMLCTVACNVNINMMLKCNGYKVDGHYFQTVLIYMESLKFAFIAAWEIFIYFVLVWLPVVLLLKYVGSYSYNTHEYEYGWFPSSLFLTGVVPAVCLIVLWTFMIAIFLMNLKTSVLKCRNTVEASDVANMISAENLTADSESMRTSGSGEHHFLTKFNIQSVILSVTVLLVNISVILVTNYAYVQVQQSSDSTYFLSKELSQVFLGMFKILWTNGVVPVILSFIFKRVPARAVLRVYVRTVVLIFNNIICPALVFAFVDPSCFLNLFNESESVTQEYIVQNSSIYCYSGYVLDCSAAGATVSEDNFSPPFVYSFQCVKSFSTAYIPVFIYSNAFIFLFTTVLFYGLTKMGSTSNVAPAFPIIFWPSEGFVSSSAVLINADAIMAAVFYHLAVLLSFGSLSPPLAFSVVATLSLIYIQWDFIIRRFIGKTFRSADISSPIDDSVGRSVSLLMMQPLLEVENNHTSVHSASSDHQLAQYVCAAFKDLWPGAERSVYVVLAVSALFMAALVFDMTADQNSIASVGYIPMIVLVIPFVLYSTISVYMSKKWAVPRGASNQARSQSSIVYWSAFEIATTWLNRRSRL